MLALGFGYTPEMEEFARRVDMALSEFGYPDLCVTAGQQSIGVSRSGGLTAEQEDAIDKAFLVAGPLPEVPGRRRAGATSCVENRTRPDVNAHTNRGGLLNITPELRNGASDPTSALNPSYLDSDKEK